jgi:hypothetical protein
MTILRPASLDFRKWKMSPIAAKDGFGETSFAGVF